MSDMYYIAVGLLLLLQKSGLAMVLDVEREKTMVQELMDFKEKLDTIIVDSFQKNERFQRALQVCTYNYCNHICIWASIYWRMFYDHLSPYKNWSI